MKSRFFTTLIQCLLLMSAENAFSQATGLEQAIREICVSSDSVKMMKETLARTESMVREKRSAALPLVSASLFGGKTYGAPAGAPMMVKAESEAYNSEIRVTQALYTFGKIGTGIRIAQQVDSSAEYGYQRNFQKLQLLGLDIFYRAVLSEMAVAVSERYLARKKELSEFLNRNFNMGQGNRAQVLAIKADLKNQESDIINKKQEARTARMDLAAFMGRPLSESIVLDTSIGFSFLPWPALPAADMAIKTALSNRGDLRSIECLTRASLDGARISRAMYLPDIAVTASLSTFGTDPSDLIDWDNRNWTAGVALRWTMFDGFASASRAGQYESDARKLQAARNAVEKMIETEVLAALDECPASDSSLAASREMFEAALESYLLTDENFKKGSGSFAELQLSEERLRLAEMGNVASRYRQVRSRAALRVAMGYEIIKL